MFLPYRRTLLAVSLGLMATTASAAPDFAACFTLDTAVTWSNGDQTVRITDATFDGAPALAVVNSGSGLSKAELYDATGRRNLGTIHYGIAAWGGDPSAPVMTDSFEQVPTFPETAKPGERFTVNGSGTRYNYNDESESEVEYEGFNDYLFVGFEPLEVKIDGQPRVFADTCHLTATFEGTRSEMWYAPRFGLIKSERYMDDQLLFTNEIESIESE